MILHLLYGGLFALTLGVDGPPAAEPEPAPEPKPATELSAEKPESSAPADTPETPAPGMPADVQIVPPPAGGQDAEAGPIPQPPDPNAPPSEGVRAVGSSGIAPLPPPPAPVPPETIPRGSWRGVGWLAIRLHVGGPIAGVAPARPTVISLGGGAEGGWRIRQWIALGSGFSRQAHEVYRENVPQADAVASFRGYMTAWDVAIVRLYAPVRGRIDPFIDLGGGLSFFDPARDRASQVGATIRASAGFEAWITRRMTLGLSGIYRANFVDETTGHVWQAAVDLGIHW